MADAPAKETETRVRSQDTTEHRTDVQTGARDQIQSEVNAERVAGRTTVDRPADPASDPSLRSDLLGDNTRSLLPPVDLVSDDTVRGSARQIGEALRRPGMLNGLFGGNPDAATVERTLRSMTDPERERLREVYQREFAPNEAPGALDRDLARYLGQTPERFRSEGLLNQRNGQTDDAANLRAALADTNRERRESMVRNIYRSLNSEQITNMESQFTNRYGSVDQAFADARFLTGTQEALQVWCKGNENVTQADREGLARTAARFGNRDQLVEAISGNTPEARAAREALMNDRSFRSDIIQRFGSPGSLGDPRPPIERIDPAIRDYLREGRIQLSTIADANSTIFGNKENVDAAVRTATDDERARFRMGYDVTRPGRTPATDEERQAAQFFNQQQAAFDRAGNRADAMRWQDMMLNGRETVVSQMARTESSGLFGSSHERNDILNAATNLNERDWRTLRNGVDPNASEADRQQAQAFRQQILDATRHFAPNESERIMQILDQKAGRETFSEAQRVGRGFEETVRDGGQSTFLGLRVSNEAGVVQAIGSMTPEQAREYRDNPETRRQVDERVAQLQPDRRILSERLLAQTAQTGEPPKIDGVDRVLYGHITGARPQQVLADAERAVQNDPELRTRLTAELERRQQERFTQTPRGPMTTVDQALASALESSMYASIDRIRQDRPMLNNDNRMLLGPSGIISEANQTVREMLRNGGQLTPEQQYRLGFDMNDIYRRLPNATEEQRRNLLDNMTPDRQELARKITAQNGEMRLEDYARSYVIEGGDSARMRQTLAAATPEQLRTAREEYARNFPGRDMSNDVIARSGDNAAMRHVLNPPTDGRQDLYNNYEQFLRNRGGITFNGSALTLDRATQVQNEALQAYTRAYQALPPERQREMDEIFGRALEQHKESVERSTQILLDGAITAATLGMGGPALSAAAVLRYGAAGAFNTAAMSLARGEFDPNRLASDMLNGGLSAFTGGVTREGAVVATERLAARDAAQVTTRETAEEASRRAGRDALETNPRAGELSTPRDQVTPRDTVSPVEAPRDPVTPRDSVTPGDATVPRETVTPRDSVIPITPRETAAEVQALTETGRRMQTEWAAESVGQIRNAVREQLQRPEIIEAREALGRARQAVDGRNDDAARQAYREYLTARNLPIPNNIDRETANSLRKKVTEAETSFGRLDNLINGSGQPTSKELIAMRGDLEALGVSPEGRQQFERFVRLREATENQQAPALAARTVDTLSNPNLTEDQRFEALRQHVQNQAQLTQLERQWPMIERSAGSPQEAQRLLERLKQNVEYVAAGRGELNVNHLGNVTRFESRPTRDQLQETANNLRFPGTAEEQAAARQNFVQNAERFFAEGNGKEHNFAIVERNGQHILLRSRAGDQEGSLKFYMQPLDQRGNRIGIETQRNGKQAERDLHVLYRTVENPDGTTSLRPVEIKQGTDTQDRILYQRENFRQRTIAPEEYPWANSPWRNVDEMLEFLNGAVSRINYPPRP